MPETPKKTTPANPSPRLRFQSGNGNIAAHHNLIELPAFDRGIDFAMLQYSSDLSESGQNQDNMKAMANGYKLQGAKEFLSLLKTLAEVPQFPMARKDVDNLTKTN